MAGCAVPASASVPFNSSECFSLSRDSHDCCRPVPPHTGQGVASECWVTVRLTSWVETREVPLGALAVDVAIHLTWQLLVMFLESEIPLATFDISSRGVSIYNAYVNDSTYKTFLVACRSRYYSTAHYVQWSPNSECTLSFAAYNTLTVEKAEKAAVSYNELVLRERTKMRY